ncbi:MAG TPA: cytochrome P450 [Blastocatellia bacterium]|nr:cytochrome P450 [Blastocatellia bacterium]
MFNRILAAIKAFFAALFAKEDARLHRLWAAALPADARLEKDLSNLKEHAVANLQRWLANPEVLRTLFAGLREHKPIVLVRGFAIVTRHADVTEVLAQDEHFTVRQIYAAKMERTSGSFFLGMDRGEQYSREHGLLRQATRPADDLPRIASFVSTRADQLIEAARPDGKIEVVNGLFRLVATRLVADYFGVPGPNEATQMNWHRAIFRDIFLNLNNDPQVTASADTAARQMNDYMDELIARRKAELAAGQNGRDDFLTRLLRMQSQTEPAIDDAWIRRNVGGTILGAIETTSKAATQALDQLLSRPEQLQASQQAARAGDDRLLSAYVFEALRFNPHNPIIIRHCDKPYTLARGSRYEATIPEGTLVFAGTVAAMFDPEAFPAPDEFRSNRPTEPFLHFGYGMHTCFGEYINRVQLPVALQRLLRLKSIRRAAGDAGRLQFDGPFPNRLVVEFEP